MRGDKLDIQLHRLRGRDRGVLGDFENIARAHTTPGWLTVGAGFTGLGLSATSVFVSAYMAATGDDENYHPANVTGSCLNAVGMAITTGVALYSNMDNFDFGHDCVVAHLNEGGLALAGFGALMALTLTTPVQFGARAYHMLSFVSTVAAGLGGYFNGMTVIRMGGHFPYAVAYTGVQDGTNQKKVFQGIQG